METQRVERSGQRDEETREKEQRPCTWDAGSSSRWCFCLFSISEQQHRHTLHCAPVRAIQDMTQVVQSPVSDEWEKKKKKKTQKVRLNGTRGEWRRNQHQRAEAGGTSLVSGTWSIALCSQQGQNRLGKSRTTWRFPLVERWNQKRGANTRKGSTLYGFEHGDVSSSTSCRKCRHSRLFNSAGDSAERKMKGNPRKCFPSQLEASVHAEISTEKRRRFTKTKIQWDDSNMAGCLKPLVLTVCDGNGSVWDPSVFWPTFRSKRHQRSALQQ